MNIVKKCQFKNVHPQFALTIINSVKYSLEELEVHDIKIIEINQLRNLEEPITIEN